jgi:hypothetical protein
MNTNLPRLRVDPVAAVYDRRGRPGGESAVIDRRYRAFLLTVGSELARAVGRSASKLADLRNPDFFGVLYRDSLLMSIGGHRPPLQKQPAGLGKGDHYHD